MEKIILKAPAKINLTLDILYKRDDLYHEIETIMIPVDLCDTVSIEKTKSNKIEIYCDNVDIPQNDGNICYHAVSEFVKYTGISFFGVLVNINKVIPFQAGLAGGSTDAAATLLGLNEIYQTNLTRNELENIGSKIGSDVPFCIRKKVSLAKGRGEILKDISSNIDFFILLVKPNVNSNTQLAYKNFLNKKDLKRPKTAIVIQALELNDIGLLSENLVNVFEQIIDVSEVNAIKKTLLSLGATATSMTGSGTTVFGIFTNKLNFINAYEKLIENRSYKVFKCKPFKD